MSTDIPGLSNAQYQYEHASALRGMGSYQRSTAQRAADELQAANEQGIIALRKLRAQLEGDEPEVSLGDAYHEGDFPKAVVELLGVVSVDGSADDILRSLSLTFKVMSECCEAARGNH